jgi:hypothetical protein
MASPPQADHLACSTERERERERDDGSVGNSSSTREPTAIRAARSLCTMINIASEDQIRKLESTLTLKQQMER